MWRRKHAGAFKALRREVPLNPARQSIEEQEKKLAEAQEKADPGDDWEPPDYDFEHFRGWAAKVSDENDLSFFLAYLGWEGGELTPEEIAQIVETFQANPMIPLLALENPGAQEYIDAVYDWAVDTMEKQGLFEVSIVC